ncbi:hypothetical protein CBS9595_003461 [Malassezia furfur]|nr:hypothetical protein CBS9595_003461 [Malassezia furfur]
MQLLRGLTKRGEPRTERPYAAPGPAPAPGAAGAPALAPAPRAAQPLSPASPTSPALPLSPPLAASPRLGDGTASPPPPRAIRFNEPGTRARPAGGARDDLYERLGATPSTRDEALSVRRSASDHHIRARAERTSARPRVRSAADAAPTSAAPEPRRRRRRMPREAAPTSPTAPAARSPSAPTSPVLAGDAAPARAGGTLPTGLALSDQTWVHSTPAEPIWSRKQRYAWHGEHAHARPRKEAYAPARDAESLWSDARTADASPPASPLGSPRAPPSAAALASSSAGARAPAVPFRPLGGASDPPRRRAAAPSGRQRILQQAREAPADLATLATLAVGHDDAVEQETERERDARWASEERERHAALQAAHRGAPGTPPRRAPPATRRSPRRAARATPAVVRTPPQRVRRRRVYHTPATAVHESERSASSSASSSDSDSSDAFVDVDDGALPSLPPGGGAAPAAPSDDDSADDAFYLAHTGTAPRSVHKPLPEPAAPDAAALLLDEQARERQLLERDAQVRAQRQARERERRERLEREAAAERIRQQEEAAARAAREAEEAERARAHEAERQRRLAEEAERRERMRAELIRQQNEMAERKRQVLRERRQREEAERKEREAEAAKQAEAARRAREAEAAELRKRLELEAQEARDAARRAQEAREAEAARAAEAAAAAAAAAKAAQEEKEREAQRLALLEAERAREAQEREAQRLALLEAERAREAQERQAQREQERLEQERLAREREEQARVERERLEAERVERERQERLEAERLEKERVERERLERLERERQEQERRERLVREEQARRERLVREEAERKERVGREARERQERLAREERERKERKERIRRMEREKKEAEERTAAEAAARAVAEREEMERQRVQIEEKALKRAKREADEEDRVSRLRGRRRDEQLAAPNDDESSVHASEADAASTVADDAASDAESNLSQLLSRKLQVVSKSATLGLTGILSRGADRAAPEAPPAAADAAAEAPGGAPLLRFADPPRGEADAACLPHPALPWFSVAAVHGVPQAAAPLVVVAESGAAPAVPPNASRLSTYSAFGSVHSLDYSVAGDEEWVVRPVGPYRDGGVRYFPGYTAHGLVDATAPAAAARADAGEQVLALDAVRAALVRTLGVSDVRRLAETSRTLRAAYTSAASTAAVLARYLGHLGWRATEPDPLPLTLHDCEAFVLAAVVEEEYVAAARAYLQAGHQLDRRIPRLARATLRARARVLARLRLAEADTPGAGAGDGALLLAAPDGTTRHTRLGAPYEPGRVSLFRVWAPEDAHTAEAYSTELQRTERELFIAGIWRFLQRGDMALNVAKPDQFNDGRYIFNGEGFVPLSTVFDPIGHLPPFLNMLLYPPQYYHGVVRYSRNAPVVYLDLLPWRSQLVRSIQLVRDNVETLGANSQLYRVAKWLYRAVITIEMPATDTPSYLESPYDAHHGWNGTLVLEAEGTSEHARALLTRCVAPREPDSLLASMLEAVMKGASESLDVPDVQPYEEVGAPPTFPWSILRERSRAGLVWLRLL